MHLSNCVIGIYTVIPMDEKEFYENMYGDSRIEKPKPPFFYRYLRRFELNRYDLAFENAPGGENVIEIGCGDGDLLFRLNTKYKEVWGIDIAEPRINRIQKKLREHDMINVRVEDTNQRLDFEDGHFSTVISVAVLEHIFDPYHLISECNRLLHHKGTLIVQVPNIAYLPNRMRLFFGLLPVTSTEIGWDGGHLHYFTRSTLKKLFEDGGFEAVKITSTGIFVGIRKVLGSLLCGDILIVGIKK
jgi:ubiquinone/menaquinone biosynthesis C-methylase UbiE